MEGAVEGAAEEILYAQYRLPLLDWHGHASRQNAMMQFAGRCPTNRPSRHARAAASNTK